MTSLKPTVLFVREWEQQMSSSGCCGRLEGDFLSWGGERCFAERRRIMEDVGELYRAVRERFGHDVDLRIVDPRNVLALIPTLLAEFRRRRVPPSEAFRTLFGLKVSSVVVNGRLASGEGLPDVERLIALVEAELEAPSRSGAGAHRE